MLLLGKTAVITGANRGIGRAVLDSFMAQGANVFACVRQEKTEMMEACKKFSETSVGWAKPLFFDMNDDEAMKAAVKEIRASKVPVDILVNVAGIVPENRLFQMAKEEEMQRVFDVNFFATMRLTKLISKLMVRHRKGSIVNIASIAALDGEPGQVEYVASKAALIGATKKLALEFGAYGIRVNAVAPGVTQTDMVASMQDDLRRRMAETTILRRLAEPREIANVVAFLASDMASYMTGQVVRVDGGVRR